MIAGAFPMAGGDLPDPVTDVYGQPTFGSERGGRETGALMGQDVQGVDLLVGERGGKSRRLLPAEHGQLRTGTVVFMV